MIDAFYTYDNFEMIALLLDCFKNLTRIPEVLKSIISSELSDKVCTLLTRKEEAFIDIRSKSLDLLVNLISELTVERIAKTLKGKIKVLINDRNDEIINASLLLLKRILAYDTRRLSMDFELLQSLVHNLAHSKSSIFSKSMQLIIDEELTNDEDLLKLTFKKNAVINMIQAFYNMENPSRVKFFLILINVFVQDYRKVSIVTAKGGQSFYIALVTF